MAYKRDIREFAPDSVESGVAFAPAPTARGVDYSGLTKLAGVAIGEGIRYGEEGQVKDLEASIKKPVEQARAGVTSTLEAANDVSAGDKEQLKTVGERIARIRAGRQQGAISPTMADAEIVKILAEFSAVKSDRVKARGEEVAKLALGQVAAEKAKLEEDPHVKVALDLEHRAIQFSSTPEKVAEYDKLMMQNGVDDAQIKALNLKGEKLVRAKTTVYEREGLGRATDLKQKLIEFSKTAPNNADYYNYAHNLYQLEELAWQDKLDELQTANGGLALAPEQEARAKQAFLGASAEVMSGLAQSDPLTGVSTEDQIKTHREHIAAMTKAQQAIPADQFLALVGSSKELTQQWNNLVAKYGGGEKGELGARGELGTTIYDIAPSVIAYNEIAEGRLKGTLKDSVDVAATGANALTPEGRKAQLVQSVARNPQAVQLIKQLYTTIEETAAAPYKAGEAVAELQRANPLSKQNTMVANRMAYDWATATNIHGEATKEGVLGFSHLTFSDETAVETDPKIANNLRTQTVYQQAVDDAGQRYITDASETMATLARDGVRFSYSDGVFSADAGTVVPNKAFGTGPSPANLREEARRREYGTRPMDTDYVRDRAFQKADRIARKLNHIHNLRAIYTDPDVLDAEGQTLVSGVNSLRPIEQQAVYEYRAGTEGNPGSWVPMSP